jgi:hypothetical protein
MALDESSAAHAPVERDGTVTAARGEKLLVMGSAAGGLGGALAAAFAALCCVGPSAVALLGAGGALAASQLTPCRPALLLLSLALLAFGFWRAYGRHVAVNGRSCPVRVGRLARTVLWVSAATWLVAAVLPTR